MKKKSIIFIFILSFFLFCDKKVSYLEIKEKSISNIIDGIKYEAGNWEHPDYGKPFKSLGNHRVIIKVKENADAVFVKIPWRRADKNPEKKGIIIINTKNKSRINEVIIKNINNESCTLIFKPQKNSKLYYIYYYPHQSTGGYYPKLKYLSPIKPRKSLWFQQYNNKINIKKLAKAKVLAIQSINEFHSFFPMEIIATKKEIKKMILKNPKIYYLFPEYRQYSIRMKDYLPKHWVDRSKKNGISDNVKKGEFYTFQIGLYASKLDLKNVKVLYTELKSEKREIIPISNIHSFNTGGINLYGKPFKKELNVKTGKIQALWFGIKIPKKIKKGIYSGNIMIKPSGRIQQSIVIKLNVLDKEIKNSGDDRPENMSRLRWLDSKIGNDKEFIPKPFTPVIINKRSLKILGREIHLGKMGLPEEVNSYFDEEMNYLKNKPEPILAAPVIFQVIGQDQKIEKWKSKVYKIKQAYKAEGSWDVLNESDNFILKVNGCLEYDGTLNYKLELISKKDIDIKNISLKIPMEPDAAELMVGLGNTGGKRPEEFSWKWDVNFHQEGVWLGNINKGLQFVLRDNNYERPLNTNFYHNKPLNLPKSWGNNRRGGIKIKKKDGSILVDNYSGEREIKKGEILNFNIRFLITPFKIIDFKKHFSTRFVHKYVPVEKAEKWGGTVINVHHANEVNPFINYPFYNIYKQKRYINTAHKKGIKVKLYNTIRELSYKAYEFFALRSLGDEIFNDGKGGGHSWLQEHLRSNYHSAWHATNVNDASILNKGTSRWTNYYIEGLNWLAEHQRIDGLYLDDIAFDRKTIKRIISVLSKHRDEVIIDLHSANQYNSRDGFINSVFLYMEHLPFVSRLWFGEYFDYNAGPDYWLTEVSGIPFGLTGEMLEKGGHPFRGMVFGMTNRVYQNFNPGAIWKLFDDFDIKNSRMLGYWIKKSPIKTSVKDIKSTVYLHSNKALIAIGSWSKEDKEVRLSINWKTLGFKKHKAKLYSPLISGLQKKKTYDPEHSIKIEGNQGLFLILDVK